MYGRDMVLAQRHIHARCRLNNTKKTFDYANIFLVCEEDANTQLLQHAATLNIEPRALANKTAKIATAGADESRISA